MLLQRPWVHGITICPLVLTSLVTGWVPVVPWLLAPSLTSLDDLVSLLSTLSKAHLGYLKLVELPWDAPFLFGEAVDCCKQFWVRVLMTLYLAEMMVVVHCKYWSMWIGFLYTVVYSLPSVSGFTMVSMKGMAPFSLLFSTVNCMAGLTLLTCCRKYCLFSSFWMTKVSSTYMCNNLGVRGST